MAEYKIYKCDYCGASGALHFTIPLVDIWVDALTGERQSANGYVDLCPKHAVERLSLALSDEPMDRRRYIWKRLSDTRLMPSL